MDMETLLFATIGGLYTIFYYSGLGFKTTFILNSLRFVSMNA
jgi:hypothetical protein